MGIVNFLSRIIGQGSSASGPAKGAETTRLTQDVGGWATSVRTKKPLFDQTTYVQKMGFDFPSGPRPSIELVAFGHEGKNHKVPSNLDSLQKHWKEEWKWTQDGGRLHAQQSFDAYHWGNTPVFRITPPKGEPMLVEVQTNGEVRELPSDTRFRAPGQPTVDIMEG